MSKISKDNAKAARKEVSKDAVKDPKNTKITFECSLNEKAYIKMLAAKGHMTISQFILSHLRQDFPRLPNAETIVAFKESEQDIKDGTLKSYNKFDDMWNDLMSDDA